MPPASRRSTSSGPAPADPDTDAYGGVSTEPDQQAAGGPGVAGPDERTTMRLHLPLFTLTVSRPAGQRGGAPAPSPSAAAAGTPGGGQRLLFYTGVAALGVAGVVEWPIAAAIAAGTYLAARSRPAAR